MARERDPRVAFLRELERADEDVAATLRELDELAAEIERTRNRAVELERFHRLLPTERERRAEDAAETERALAVARETLAQAHEELAAAEAVRDEGRLAAARRFEVRARDAVSVAERRAEEARRERDRLDEQAACTAREADALAERASELADVLRERPRVAEDAGQPPAPGLAGTAEWASRARAALFVARGVIAAERDALVRQANELGSVVLGEPLMAASAATVTRRVEGALGSD